MAIVTTPVPSWDRDESQRRVTHPLERLRGYIRTYVTLEGLAVIGQYLALWFWIGLAIDWGFFKVFGVDWVQALPKEFRAIILACLVAGLVLVVARKVFSRLFREFRPSALALVLERRFTAELGDRLITAVEMADPRVSERYNYSQPMIDQTIRDAAERIDRLPVRDVFAWRRLRRYALRLVVLTVGVFVLVGAAYCAIARAGVGDFLQRFGNTAAIWFERNILLRDTVWPRRAHLELVNFPASGDLRVGRDAPPPSLRVRALKWVIADKDAFEGWRPLRWSDLNGKLLGHEPGPLPEDWRSLTVDQVELRINSGSPDQGPAETVAAARRTLTDLDALVEQPAMARRLRKLVVPDLVTVYYKGDTMRSEQTLKKEAANEYAGVLSDLKESVRFTVNGEDYYTPYKKITVVPPPSLVELMADEEQPAYLYQRPPAGGELKDLKGNRQIVKDLPVTLSGTASSIDVTAGTTLVLRGKTDKELREPDGILIHPREGSAPVSAPVRRIDSQSFAMHFASVSAPLDFVIEMIDTDNVGGLRRVVIKPIEDTPPDVDIEVEVIRKLNQGYMVTPKARIPFSGKIRDREGLESIEFQFTLASLDSQIAQNAIQVSSVMQLTPNLQGAGVLAPGYLHLLVGVTRSSADDVNARPQRLPLPAFAKRVKELARQDLARDDWEKALREPPQATLLREHTMDPNDLADSAFDVEKLGLGVSDENQKQPRFRLRLWMVATDNNIETGPGVGQSKEKLVFLIVSEDELLLEIAKVEEGLHIKLDDAVGKLKDAKLKMEQVIQELPTLQPKEFSPMAARLQELQETLTKSWDVSREVLVDYQKVLRELQVNQVRPAIIDRVERGICVPLGDVINQEFDRSDKSLDQFHKNLEEQKKDPAAGQLASQQMQELIDKLNRILDSMGDITTINQLIAQLVAIRDSELKANKEMREKYERLKEEILINQFGNPEKPPAKKPEK